MTTKKKTEAEVEPKAKAKPVPPAEPQPEPDKIDPNPVDVRDPYPTGSPPDPREEFKKIHGHYPPEEA